MAILYPSVPRIQLDQQSNERKDWGHRASIASNTIRNHCRLMAWYPSSYGALTRICRFLAKRKEAPKSPISQRGYISLIRMINIIYVRSSSLRSQYDWFPNRQLIGPTRKGACNEWLIKLICLWLITQKYEFDKQATRIRQDQHPIQFSFSYPSGSKSKQQ